MALFQRNILDKYLSALNKEQIDTAFQHYCSYFKNPERQNNILASKEEQFQEGFLRELFVNILGYTLNPDPDYNLITEKKDVNDSRKADGAILQDGEVVGVIELKDHKTPDLGKVERQAFGYKNQHKKATYVIISNFQLLRFYIDNAVEFVEWNLFNLSRDEFAEMWLCLSRDCLMQELPKKVKNESVSSEEQITNKLYKDYITFKRELFNNILALNTTDDGEHSTSQWKILLFKKTQKLLDRLLFIFFAEDSGLLPPNSIHSIIEQWRTLVELDEDISLYSRLKKYFGYMNTGYKGKKYDVFAYNGGLFKPDEVLDNLMIDDELLAEHAQRISEYDFASEVDVNILGHIFENSLNEIEEVTAQLEDGQAPTVSKRKKDGVFYTPQYITKYIVENTVGRLCNEKKAEMRINEQEYYSDTKRSAKQRERMLEALTGYREWLLQITICDPACGSGAFLNAALRFLMDEHHRLDEMEAAVTGSDIVFPGIENAILENNLYGVDINEESVEIARLALWLRTAKPYRKLSSLNANIKCGNSLISDPAVAGDKAFDWEKEFPQVFEKGGFDVVIGNPPYVDIKQMDNVQVRHLFEQYDTCENRINLYSIFIQKGYIITKEKGYLSFINPNSMLVNSSYTKLRKLIIDDLYCLVKLPDDVFEDAKVETIIFGIQKKHHTDTANVILYQKDEHISDIHIERGIDIDKEFWKNSDSYSFNLYANKEISDLLKKMSVDGDTHIEKVKLVDIADFSLGITPYDKYKGHTEDVIKNRKFHSLTKTDDTYKPLIAGENVIRYYVSQTAKEYISYGDWLGAPREERFFIEPRIIVRQIVSGNPSRIYAGYTEEALYFTQIGFGIIPKDGYEAKYILVLLNSWLMNFYHKYKYLDLEKELFQKILIANCKEFPIPVIASEQQQVFAREADKMISLISSLQSLRSRFLRRLIENLGITKITGALETFDELTFAEFQSELKKQKVKLTLKEQDEWEDYFNQYRQQCTELRDTIANTETEIDNLVYDLYSLTPEERKIVEEN